MNALTPVRLLRIAENASTGADQVAVLGRDIRTSSERIARYCVMAHEPVYEDLVTLVESMAFWDRRIVRKRTEGWTRELSIQVPVYEHGQFQRAAVVQALAEAARFLTGDQWSFEFVARKGPAPSRQGALALPQAAMKHVVPFSDGLDSFAQVQLSVREYGRDAVMLVRSGLGRDRIFPKLVSLRVPRKFGGVRMREVSYRTRPLVFYTLAAIGAVVTGAEAVVIGESGQGAFGPACLPFADEWWFRSAHPAFVRRWANFLGIILDKPIRFEQPQLWKTKGEVLSNLQAEGLMAGWEQTNSCSTRPNDRYGRYGCGICGGCLLRAVSAHAAGLTSPIGDNAFDVYALEDVARHRDGRERQMTSGERAVAVRAIATMVELARLADSSDGALLVQREARLIDSANPMAAQTKLLRLLKQHQAEWGAFMSSLPERSWVREIVGQL
jgi:7-cyano-7-deazaguanine synthase in queuosine biosynthesis